MLRFEYRVHPNWPSLSWLASFRLAESTIVLMHGSRMETRPDWFCEAVWDGPFEEGDFNRTDIVSGSGARLRGEHGVFVSSGSTVDRLQWIAHDGRHWLSSSTACLMSAVGGTFDPAYPRYFHDFFSIVHGLEKHVRQMPISSGVVNYLYFDNAVWDGRSVSIEKKPLGNRSFESFDAYHRFLVDSVRGLSVNLKDPSRSWIYSMLGTLSTGYDSPTVTTLARPFGL